MSTVVDFAAQRAARRGASSWEPWVDKKAVAAHTGRSTRWVEICVRDRGLPSHPPVPGSNRRRFRLSEVDRWMEGQ